MTGYQFHNAVLTIADHRESGVNVQRIMRGIGFAQITLTRNEGQLLTLLRGDPPADLLVCDTNIPDANICNVIRAIRHHEVGADPFLPIIALSWHPTVDVVRRAIEAGADNVLVNPVSPVDIETALKRLIERRKPFVVTSDYIGPDRRRDRRKPEDYPLIDPPFLLRLKANNMVPLPEFRRAVARAVTLVNRQKVLQHALRANFLAVKTVLAYRVPDEAGVAAEHLERLMWVAEDATRRICDTPYADMAPLFESLFKTAYSLRDNHPEPMPRELGRLSELAQAIRAAAKAKSGKARTVQAARPPRSSGEPPVKAGLKPPPPAAPPKGAPATR